MTKHPAVAKAYRERVLRAISSGDVYTIMREIGQTQLDNPNALDCRYYLLEHWDDNIRDRVMAIIRLNVDLETSQ